jgi:hypothetical protein
VDRRHDRERAIEQRADRFAKALGGEFHPPKLLARLTRRPSCSRWIAGSQALERLDVDAVPAHSRRPRELDVGQQAALAREGLDQCHGAGSPA